MTAPSHQRPLPALQVLRALAALSVVAFHTNLAFGPNLLVTGSDLGGIFLFGHAGVDLFFVLSGFIIAYAHWNDPQGWLSLRRYAYRRLVRIYPMTLATTLTLVAILPVLRWITHDPSFFSFDLMQLTASVLLIPLRCDYVPSVLWSLQNEMYFYLIFCTYFVRLSLLAVAGSAWKAAIVANHAFHFAPSLSACTSGILSLYNLLFAGGIIAYISSRSMAFGAPKSFAVTLAVTGALLASTMALIDVTMLKPVYLGQVPAEGSSGTKLLLRAGYSAGFVLLVLAASLLNWSPHGFTGRTIVKTGDASFSIYLVHLPIVGTFCRLQTPAGDHSVLGAVAVFFAIVLASWLCGIFVHTLVEKPMLERFKGHRMAAPAMAQS